MQKIVLPVMMDMTLSMVMLIVLILVTMHTMLMTKTYANHVILVVMHALDQQMKNVHLVMTVMTLWKQILLVMMDVQTVITLILLFSIGVLNVNYMMEKKKVLNSIMDVPNVIHVMLLVPLAVEVQIKTVILAQICQHYWTVFVSIFVAMECLIIMEFVNLVMTLVKNVLMQLTVVHLVPPMNIYLIQPVLPLVQMELP